jgi:hypothetical protein
VLVDGIPVFAAVLLVLASTAVARQVAACSHARLGAQILAGAAVGGVPAALIFDACRGYRPDFGFVVFLFGCLLGVVLGMLGTATAGHAWSARRPMRFGTLGALLGAAIGTFLAFVTICDRALAIDLDTAPHVIVVGALLVGSFATLGFELCVDR